MEAITAGVIERARELKWYHSLELTPDYVTEGMFDLRDQMDVYGLPERLDGMRCLDIGTWDGFWAFEMERRGAAEVIALDLDDERELDWPPRRRPAKFNEEPRGSGFRLAKEQFDSKVERVIQNIYTATPEELGTFDLVFCGSVMIHLRDQYLALNRIADLCSGLFISAEEYDRPTSLIPRPDVALPGRPRQRRRLLAAEPALLGVDAALVGLRPGRAQGEVQARPRAPAGRCRTS